MYNYRREMMEDVRNYIDNNVSLYDFSSREELEEYLNDTLWVEDSVTGNASGSYTFSTYDAEENLAHNFDLIEQAASDLGIEPIITSGYEHGAEWWDVTIRCWMLSEIIGEVLDEIELEHAYA